MNQNILKSILWYDEISGQFIWLINSRNRVNKGQVAGSRYYNKGKWYIQIKIKGKMYSAHRLAWLYLFGYYPNKIDHIDGNGENNAKINLRESTNSLNRFNTKSNNPLGRGVTKVAGKYQAQIKFNGITKYLGLFTTAEQAQEAYNKVAQELWGNIHTQGQRME